MTPLASTEITEPHVTLRLICSTGAAWMRSSCTGAVSPLPPSYSRIIGSFASAHASSARLLELPPIHSQGPGV
jgi:hypothetical protein